MQLIAWKDLSPKWPVMCWGLWSFHCYSVVSTEASILKPSILLEWFVSRAGCLNNIVKSLNHSIFLSRAEVFLTIRLSLCLKQPQSSWESLCVQKFVHELRITNQVMYLNPPVEEVRMNIIGELYSWEANILTLSRITHSRYQASYSHSLSVVQIFYSPWNGIKNRDRQTDGQTDRQT